MDDYAPLEELHKLGPWDAIPISAAGEQLKVLARRVADSREEVALTDEDGKIVAVVMSVSKLEDLEDDLAIAQGRVDELEGVPPVPHEEIVKRREEAGGARSSGAARPRVHSTGC